MDSEYWGQIHSGGEVNYDEIDMIPEISVGQLPASTRAIVLAQKP